jgi:hypothetical protein
MTGHATESRTAPTGYRRLLERAWRELPCVNPLRSAAWVPGRYNVVSHDNWQRFVLQEDERGPLFAEPALDAGACDGLDIREPGVLPPA